MNKPFLFTVIIPIYNTEAYVEEAINSVVNQSIGFEDHIQLILVNDGSTDNSGLICKRYKESYPNNIIYLEKKNGGVSSARNLGMKYIKGEYVNFLDSDDTWEKDALLHFSKFFSEHPDVRLATARLIMWGAKEGTYHHLDYKFGSTKVVDILKNYNLPEFSVAKTFFNHALLEGKQFLENLAIGEDVLFTSKLILDEGKYGIVREAQYFYRKRDDGSSAIDHTIETKGWYLDTPRKAYLGIIEHSKKVYGEVIPYVQYALITDIQWRLSPYIPDYFTEDEKEEYVRLIKETLDAIDDNIIMAQRRLAIPKKSYFINLKHSKDNSPVSLDTIKLAPKYTKVSAAILSADTFLHIEGVANEKYLSKNLYLIVKDEANNIFNVTYHRSEICNRTGPDHSFVLDGYSYSIDLPLRDHAKYHFELVYKESDRTVEIGKLQLYSGEHSRLSTKKHSFFSTPKHIIKYIDNEVCVYDYSFKTFLASTRRLHAHLLSQGKNELVNIRRKAIKNKLTKRKPIWLISDRSDRAADNGFALFKYIYTMGLHKDKDVYFVLSTDSPDYDKVSALGKVLELNSKEHLIKHLAADLIISSSADRWVLNPFDSEPSNVQDLFEFSFVFLQHGVIMNDLSSWLQKFSKNISLFVTSAKQEYDSITEGKYSYTGEVVKLLGLPRYDELEEKETKQIAIIPSWRRGLSLKPLGPYSERPYNPTFNQSAYFEFYNNLINDPKLIGAMSRYGYSGVFILHPSHIQQMEDFTQNDTISILGGGINYSEVISLSSMLVTDYSSISMDFAYLKKPIVYAQFDEDLFFKEQGLSKGYFDYKRDGFGPVTDNYDSTIEAIIEYIAKNCQTEDKYLARSSEFFAFHDKENCARVYDAITKVQYYKQ